jgi:hypothetical protein
MPEVFLMYAILRPTKNPLTDTVYQRLETVEQVQTDVKARFQTIHEQWREFEEIEFTPSYRPDEGELFFLTDFEVPERLQKATLHRTQFDEFQMNKLEAKGLTLKAILCIHKDLDADKVIYYFQQIDKRQILDRKKWYPLVYLHNKYAPLEGHALAIGDNLTAIIDSKKKLLFRSFRDTGQFLDLSSFFKEATDEDIKGILGSSKVAPSAESVTKIISLCDDPMRKKFALLKLEGTLDNGRVKVKELVEKAKEFEIEVETQGSGAKAKLVFPTEKGKLKLFLKFLCQDYYESLLTGDKCLSNSHRKLS